MTNTLANYLERLASLPQEEAVRELTQFKGVGEAKAKAALAWATPQQIKRLRFGAEGDQEFKRAEFRLKHGTRIGKEWNEFAVDRFELPPGLQQEAVVKRLIEHIGVISEGETDEPVTADIKRLIRLPGSLHGKTGLRVTPLTIDEFERFDPLRDAVALGDEPVRVVVSKPTVVPLLGHELTVQPGEQELPLYQAMFVVLRRAALRPLPVAATHTS